MRALTCRGAMLEERNMDGSIPSKKARADQAAWRPQTRAVRGGQLRSNFDETSEALYLTSGYAYASAELLARDELRA